jgi:hypothetical protein
MSEGAQLCEATGAASSGAAISAWDQAFALYAGAGQGGLLSDGSGGSMMWALVDGLCQRFGTCPATNHTGIPLNDMVRKALTAGQASIKARDCKNASDTVSTVLSLMRVPLAQGIINFAYKADPKVPVDKAASAGDRGAGWAYAAALLPAVDACNSNAASTIRSNLDPAASSPVKDGYEAVYNAVRDVHTCLGITCAQLGGLLNPATYVIRPCTDDGTASDATGADGAGYNKPGSDKSSAGVTAGKVIGAIVAVALFVAVVVGLYFVCCRRRKNIDAPLMPPGDEVDNTFG